MGGRKQVNKRSTYTRPGMPPQQSSAALMTIVLPSDLALCTLVRPLMCLWLPSFVDRDNWSASELLGTAAVYRFDPRAGG